MSYTLFVVMKNKNICPPREDSDKPWHPPSLIRVLTVHMKDNSNMTVLISWRVWSYLLMVLPCTNLLLLFFVVVVFLLFFFFWGGMLLLFLKALWRSYTHCS